MAETTLSVFEVKTDMILRKPFAFVSNVKKPKQATKELLFEDGCGFQRAKKEVSLV